MNVVVALALLGIVGVDGAKVRFATFNIQELSAKKLQAVDSQMRGTQPQLKKAAAILQLLRPDIVLINEIDGQTSEAAENPATWFRDRYLAVGQFGQQPLEYAHIYYAPSNTGEPTGRDLDKDGKTNGPADAQGFGRYPGEYGMALYSRFPIDRDGVRTFRKLLWKNVPGNLIPDGTNGKPNFYDAGDVAIMRLSSKSHWDVPIVVDRATVHCLCSHPTPPIFDGDEDRNGRRNYDELRLWRDYLTGGEAAAYIRDDRGRPGGLPQAASFVMLGDLNAEPVRAEKTYGGRPSDLVLKHPRIQDPKPTSNGGPLDEGPNLVNYKPYKTSHFGRIDYALPSKDLKVVGTGVFWPAPGEPHREWIDQPDPASDHRLVWVEIEVARTKR